MTEPVRCRACDGRGFATSRSTPRSIASDLVYEGRVWDVRSDTVRYGDGEIVRQYVDHPGAVGDRGDRRRRAGCC